VQLTHYAELAVRVVNSGAQAAGTDALSDVGTLRRFLADRPELRRQVSAEDLAVFRQLRDRLRDVFEAADAGRDARTVDLLNGLLVEHPPRPQVSSHDGGRPHLHLAGSDTSSECYAAAATTGLVALVTTLGVDRLGVCRAAPCRRVYVDTSTNRSRRYCSDRCATRANVAAWRARQRSAAAPGPARHQSSRSRA